MVDPSIHPNWARSSSSQRSMAYTISIFGKPHEYSGPTVRDTVMALDKGGLVLRGPFPDIHQGQIDETGQNVDHIEAHSALEFFYHTGCRTNAVPLAAESEYDFRELGAYLGNVG